MKNHFSLAMKVALGLMILLVSACNNKSASNDSRIVATTGMVRDVVQQVVGTNETVTALMGESVDPHLYSPLGPDISALNRAEIIFYTGLHLEGKMGGILEELEGKGKTVIAVGERIPEDQLIPEGEGEKAFDPHVWMSVSTWEQTLDVVLDVLKKNRPEQAATYQANADAFRAKLSELDQYVNTAIGKIPEERRILVTAHDAFSYFGRDYGLEVEGIQGISTDDEAGLRRINALVDLLVERKIPAIFVESTVPPKHVNSLREGAKNRGHEVAIGGELFSDAMGAPGTYRGTYLGMMDHNATVVARALGGPEAAPTGGWSGKLTEAAAQGVGIHFGHPLMWILIALFVFGRCLGWSRRDAKGRSHGVQHD